MKQKLKQRKCIRGQAEHDGKGKTRSQRFFWQWKEKEADRRSIHYRMGL
jgi:hypothetical protein